jgi:hypothetical protein
VLREDLHVTHFRCELQGSDAFVVGLLGQGDSAQLEKQEHALLLRHLDSHMHRGPTALVHVIETNTTQLCDVG